MRTPLTYYGGKQKLAAQIATMMPRHEVYLEPFCGGAAVLFAKPPAQRETINDLDGTVMQFWRVLRDRPEELASVVALTPYGRSEWELTKVDADDELEVARRLLVNIDHSFSRSRSSWSPPSMLRDRRGRWQPGTWQNMPAKVRAAADRLSGVCLESGDALELIPRWDHPGAVIYCDPPYTGEHRTKDWHGYTHDAGTDLWPALVEILLGVRHAAVLLSGYPCDEAKPLVESGWRTIELRARKNVQARAGSSLALVPETVWLSPSVPAVRDRLWDEGAPFQAATQPTTTPTTTPTAT